MALISVSQTRQAAKRRLPRMAFDFIDGGAGRENALRRAEAAFNDIELVPRVLRGHTQFDTSCSLFGTQQSLPFGIPPIGLADLVWPKTDIALAQTAYRLDIPYILSTAASTTIEDIVKVNPDAWFQLYVGEDQSIVDNLVDRAEAAGIRKLVVTVDIPAPGRRLRDLANGFTLPLRPSPASILSFATHPTWCFATLRAGSPKVANFANYSAGSQSGTSLARLMTRQTSGRLNWAILSDLRRRWKGILVVKGVLNPLDARRIVDSGADALIVSSHGGRQFEAAPAPLTALSAIRDSVGLNFPVLMDGGIRSGTDVIVALNHGADYVFVGRPFLYAVAALGVTEGPDQMAELLRTELINAMAQLGLGTISELIERNEQKPRGV
ncbi:alpha-hydroxy acid oxidase [Ochrobactrum sp. RH2CCR150]|uniref:alpha-hydroxy acid oxidase n=1 Tax=Ochrobactrum sp. RH2CCR150 TaxID=2587044 RepID=UPI0015F8D3AC|nr:isopentenyl diphosphate isomerase/L-lactate dehydrogenase-like FMN-dependent dehydrogenase [Ochrobactrum sp. RH2CCR150]